MTIDKPGQEQRMVTKEMVDAGDAALENYRDAYSDRNLVEAIYTAMHEARPTADLGEDGELERHARQMRQALCDELPNGVGNTIDALLDRLILYREALAEIAELKMAPRQTTSVYLATYWRTAFETACGMARDVLSRSA